MNEDEKYAGLEPWEINFLKKRESKKSQPENPVMTETRTDNLEGASQRENAADKTAVAIKNEGNVPRVKQKTANPPKSSSSFNPEMTKDVVRNTNDQHGGDEVVELEQAPKEQDEYTNDGGALANIRSRITPPEVKEPQVEARRNSNLGRYNWLLQHGWSIPSLNGGWEREAEIENQARPSINSAQATRDARADAMNERVMQRKRDSIKTSWDKTITQIQKGHFDDMDGEFNEEAAADSLARIAQAYQNAGGNVDELTGFGMNRGGYAARTEKANAYKVDFNDLRTMRKQLRDYLSDGSFGTAERKSTFDSFINRIQRVIGNAGGVQADADKVRVQYLYLPEWKLREFEQNFRAYLNSLRGVARVAGSDESRNLINSRINQGEEALKAISTGENKPTVMQGVAKAANVMLKKDWAGLNDLPLVAQQNREMWDSYVEQMIRDAAIDPRLLDAQLEVAEKLSLNRYETLVGEKGGQGRRVGTENLARPDYSKYDERVSRYNPLVLQYTIPEGRNLRRFQGNESVNNNQQRGNYNGR